MSVSLWAYSPEKCDGNVCVGDCDLCGKADEIQDDINQLLTNADRNMRIYSTNRTNSAIGGEKRTNGDAIRSMTDEELANELFDLFAAFYDVEWSKEVLLDWLKEEVKE